ncbi:ABC1 family-domain-containing protein [Haematococcus lacustris]
MELNTLSPEMPQLLVEMGMNYDPDKLSKVLADSWPQVYARAITVSTSLGAFVAGLAQDAALGQLERRAPQRAAQLRKLLASLGPSFVKIGQALSSRPDLLPKTYLEALSDLQDRLPPFPTEIARAVIEEELGRPLPDMFISFTNQPVAAASLGQVYKAVLASTGEEVAVKVQRPGIGESIAVDMLLLRRLMRVLDGGVMAALGITQPLVPLVDEFAARLFTELDYVKEGHSCERFQALYGSMPRVRTPAIKWDTTSRRVLTMEWIEGVKLTNQAAMAEAGLSVVDFVDVGIECTLRQLLEQGYFHADPHPGNLLATRSGDLVYLDFGMMSEAPQYARYAIMAHVVHLVNRDYDAMCQDYYTLQFMDPSVDTRPIAPALAAFFDNVLDASVSQLNFKAIVDGLGDVLLKFPFQVPAYYALILRSLTVLEGLALQADPNYKLLAKAYPYMARRLLTDPAPELRHSFEDLILKEGQFRWNRLENLMREGSKSQDFDPSQLWLLAEWILSPTAVGVRQSVIAELARMVDAVAASDVRSRIAQQTGNIALANRLVPLQPREVETLERAQLLSRSLAMRLEAGGATLPVAAGGTGSAGSLPVQRPGSGLRELGAATHSTGSTPPTAVPPVKWTASLRPLGIPLPSLVQGLARQTWPRLERLLQQPGASDLVQDITSQLARRFTARVIKGVLGSQQQLEAARGAAAAGLPGQALTGSSRGAAGGSALVGRGTPAVGAQPLAGRGGAMGVGREASLTPAPVAAVRTR